MSEGQKPDLSKIEPIGRAPDSDEPTRATSDADGGGQGGTVVGGMPPATVVEQEATVQPPGTEPRTSPETEEQLEQLRRG
jgi:hypothetical protein